MFRKVILLISLCQAAFSFVPLIDGGKGMPKLYDGWFNEQIAKQASTAVSKAIAAGKSKIEVNFPPVPNVEGEFVFNLSTRSSFVVLATNTSILMQSCLTLQR
jgi:hypothetical protein